MPNIYKLVPLLCLSLLQACTMAPTYVRPDAPIPNVYAAGGKDASGNEVNVSEYADAANMPWQEFFKDGPMRRVVELALANNRDLRVSMLNIEKTRAEYRIQRADLLPTVNAVGASTNQHLPADLSSTGMKGMSRQYSASLGFSSFELDLFGRIRSLTEQALESYYSVEEEAKSACLSLVAETAAMYLQLVSDRELYDITEATLKNREKNLDIIQHKFSAGVVSDLDVNQAKTLVEEARVNLAASATRVGQDENHLCLLMGVPLPADLPEVRRLADVTPLPDLPAGLPSVLLERRPDIRAAEHVLKGANANIGAARANFFPRISLTGDLGKMSADYNDLFDAGSRAWSFLPQISLPIFDTGRNVARLEASNAERDIAVARYEKAIQTAFREVADSLVQREHIGMQLAAQDSLTATSRNSYDLSSKRYDAGVSSYINVLDAQRSLYLAERDLISTRLLRESNALMLYKALGGGWE